MKRDINVVDAADVAEHDIENVALEMVARRTRYLEDEMVRLVSIALPICRSYEGSLFEDVLRSWGCEANQP